MKKPVEKPAQSGTRGRPFRKGQSGNPAGRPKGSRNRVALAAEALLDGQAEAITRKLIDRALDDDPAALRLCIERILPATRRHFVQIDLPRIESATDALKAMNAVTQQMARGEISVEEAIAIAGLLERMRLLVAPARDDAEEELVPSPIPRLNLFGSAK